jgi:hypothetical protein
MEESEEMCIEIVVVKQDDDCIVYHNRYFMNVEVSALKLLALP